jgi:hypothetical protein
LLGKENVWRASFGSFFLASKNIFVTVKLLTTGTALFFGALYLLFVTVHPAVDSSKVIPNFQANTTIVLPTE